MSWNEFNTFSKLIYPYLNEELGYPPRKTQFFDEQTYVRKRGQKKGPYDGAFIDENKRILLLIEAKREGKTLTQKDCEQAFDYCLEESFSVPPPYVLVSNGQDHKWFRRSKNGKNFKYKPCLKIKYQDIISEVSSDVFTEEISLKKLISILLKIRKNIFLDLTKKYFPEGYTFQSSILGSRERKFREILNIRKTFVDSAIEKKSEKKAIQTILSSLSLSLILKILFIKIYYDQKRGYLPVNLIQKIDQLSSKFPGILKAEPYDVLRFSEKCEETIRTQLNSIRVMQALLFGNDTNPIGKIWDGLVQTEEQDLQVKSLGNVYTPKLIVKAMVNSAEKALGGWEGKKILEPACGSGHFVREIYNRIRNFYVNSHSGLTPSKVHQKALKHIRAIDIDSFAVQTTQLGMFLELYDSRDVWKELAPGESFDFSTVVAQGDFLDTGFSQRFADFKPDLIIGNPPYGVKVTNEVQSRFDLGSADSYGCFISQSIDSLKEGGFLLFIVSNTFLTTKSHRHLRGKLFNHTKIEKILQLHRNAFAGRDVFPCIFQLKKEIVLKQDRDSTYYEFVDAWPIPPKNENYEKALSFLKTPHNKIKKSEFNAYKIPYTLSCTRLNSPSLKRDQLKETFAGRQYLDKTAYNYPVLCGSASLALFCSDLPIKNKVIESKIKLLEKPTDCLLIKLHGKAIPVVKLWQIASVMQGLATADDQHFLRKSEGIEPNARRKNIKTVPKKNTIPLSRPSSLTKKEKTNGIRVLDPENDKYFIPFDKGGEQDTKSGELNNFWKPVDYWIDWSEQAVRTLKKRSNLPSGTHKKTYFRNENYYFQQGIACTFTGIYSPTYRLSFRSVFSHAENLILPFDLKLNKYLLTLLSSQLMRYLARAFIGNTVNFSTGYFNYLPIAVPTKTQLEQANKICDAVIKLKKERYKRKNLKGLTSQVDRLVEPFVNKLYGLNKDDVQEIKIWFKRRYPHFGQEEG